MAKFIAISGPAVTGKTSIINSLSEYQEFKDVVFSPDLQEEVWRELIEAGEFTENTEISSDPDYLCIYLLRLIDHHKQYLDSHNDKDVTVILDGCWLDILIYAMLSMWYTRSSKQIQEYILSKVSVFLEEIDKIYITKADDERYPVKRYHIRGSMRNFRQNRGLEIQYYEMLKNFKNVTPLSSSDINDSSLFILEDLKKLGHL